MQEKTNNINTILLLQTVAIVGFLFFQNTELPTSKPSTPPSVVASTDEVDNVRNEFKKIQSTDDKVLIHKLFAGSAEYLQVCEELNNTSQFDSILGKVQTSYGWNREKYPDFTTAVSDYLVSVDYDTPKELKTKEQRMEFAKIFDVLAEATRNE